MKRRIAVCTIALLIALLLATGGALAQTLRVDFFDVGKADAMLITTPSGERILIDAATNGEGKALAQRLSEAGVDRLDAMIITHYDKDHVGGADKMLEELTVERVIMPAYDKDSKQYAQFIEALRAEEGAEEVRMERAQELILTPEPGVTLRVTSAHEAYYGEDEENDFSLAVRLTYGETRFFFTGDAESARQRELLNEGDTACDVLKVPYHGRLEKSSREFLSACAPEIAFITDADDEPADAQVIDMLTELGAQVYCAKDGGVTVYSDGMTVRTEEMK